jgi:hypothetical protein
MRTNFREPLRQKFVQAPGSSDTHPSFGKNILCCYSILMLKHHAMNHLLPTSQGELIRSARGDRTQKEFAQLLGIHRTCLSRYESEALGAPAAVINHCLISLSLTAGSGATPWPLEQALAKVRLVVSSLEKVTADDPKLRSKPGQSNRSQR